MVAVKKTRAEKKAAKSVVALDSDDDDSDAENYQRKKNKAKPETAEVRMHACCLSSCLPAFLF